MAEAKKTVKKIAKPVKKAVKEAELIVEAAPVKTPEPAVEDVVEETAAPADEKLAKAGKHSAKALKEAEEKQAKEARKASKAEAGEKPKAPIKPPRSRLERAGKKYRELAKQIDKDKTYNLAEALELATKTSPVKFDASVELHVNLGVDPKIADQNVRDMVVLPAGTGKTLKIAVFAESEDAAKAKKAGADIAGIDEVIALLDKEQFDFEVLIAPPSLMARLGKYAKVLGPRGLMPNPKSGTVSADVAKAVTEAKGGKIEYRVDSTGIIHLAIGKVSFGIDPLVQNAEAVMNSIKAAKPASLKGVYIKSLYVTTSMGPAIKVVV